MTRFTLSAAAMAACAAATFAQAPEPAAGQPFASKFGYTVMLPAGVRPSGDGGSAPPAAALRVFSQIERFAGEAGLELSVAVGSMANPAFLGRSSAQIAQAVAAAEAEAGGKVGEPAEVAVGVLKGREFAVTKSSRVGRVVVAVAAGRAFVLRAEADGKDKVSTPAVDAFLRSLVVSRPASATAPAATAAPGDLPPPPRDPPGAP